MPQIDWCKTTDVWSHYGNLEKEWSRADNILKQLWRPNYAIMTTNIKKDHVSENIELLSSTSNKLGKINMG